MQHIWMDLKYSFWCLLMVAVAALPELLDVWSPREPQGRLRRCRPCRHQGLKAHSHALLHLSQCMSADMHTFPCVHL